MIKYVVKRLLLLIPVFLGVTFVIFFIVRLSPADPVTAILGINITEEQYLAKQAELGLDKPLLIQYVNYVINIITHLDLGISYSSGRSRAKKPAKSGGSGRAFRHHSEAGFSGHGTGIDSWHSQWHHLCDAAVLPH